MSTLASSVPVNTPFRVVTAAEPMPRVGSLRVGQFSDYEPGAEGFVIEEFAYPAYHSDPPTWVMSAWEEQGMGHLEGVFPTRSAALRALSEGI